MGTLAREPEHRDLEQAVKATRMPEDEQLHDDLQRRLQDAGNAAEHHQTELARARRVVAACRSGLEQLDAGEDKPGRDEY